MKTLKVSRRSMRFLAEPWPNSTFAMVAVALLIVGALYCAGYEALRTNSIDWPSSLVWAFHSMLPWLALYEYAKRRQLDGRDLSISFLSLATLTVLSGSLLIEAIFDFVLQTDRSSLSLQVLRRLPALVFTLILLGIMLAFKVEVRTSQAAVRDWLLEHADSISLVSAADNYIEIKLDKRVLLKRATLGAAEKALGGRGFQRVHRSHIVKMTNVMRVEGAGRALFLVLPGGERVPVGVKYKAALNDLI